MTDELAAREADEEREHPQLYEEKDMSQLIDVQSLGGADGLGGMGGGGVVTGLILGSLLGNRRGGFGGGDDGGCDSALQIMQALGDIKASVPLAEAQVQLALAGVQNDITSNVTSGNQAIMANQTASMLANANAFAGVARDIAAAITEGERNTASVIQAVSNDGAQTRALITSNQIAELNRIAAERQDEIIELRANNARDRDRHGIEITMTNAQNQNQLQFQAQAQVMSQLANLIADVGQIARATNQTIQVGNSGRTSSTSSANPTNVNA